MSTLTRIDFFLQYTLMNREKKIALITGVTGQDGSYLSKFLIEKGYRVVGLIREDSSAALRNLEYLGVLNQIELIPTNLLSLPALINLIRTLQPDEIYNLAAQSSVGVSFQNPVLTIEFNTMSTANLLEAIRTTSPKTRFYQASSSEMFGNVKTLPITNETPIHPVSPYGISKAASHWITINYREAYGLFAVCGILFNHESPLRGRNFVTKKVLETAVKICMGLTDSLTLGNLAVFRDWGYAPEYVKATWLMLQRDVPDDFIICSGEARSLEEFVREVFRKLDLDFEKFVKVDTTMHRPVDIEILYGDNKKAKQQLGWEYNITFMELIETLVRDELKCVEWELSKKSAI